jgi:hypothetical protein
VINKPPDCVTVKLNYVDIPQAWLSPEILAEAAYCKLNDPSAYDRIWMGNPGGVGGRIWTVFDEEAHIKDFEWGSIRSAECYTTMDPHSKYFPALLWIARTNISEDLYRYWVYNEWPDFNLYNKYYSEYRQEKFFSEWGSLQDLTSVMAQNDGLEHGLKVKRRFLDTRFSSGAGGENWATGTKGLMTELSRVGLHNFSCPQPKIIDIQREKILTAMRYNKGAPINEFNQPNFYVAPWCRNLIQSLKFHRTIEKSEKEDPKYKDFSDALRVGFAGMAMIPQEINEEQGTSYEAVFMSAGSESWMS